MPYYNNRLDINFPDIGRAYSQASEVAGNELLRQRMARQAEMEEQKFKWYEEDRVREMERRPMKDEKEALEYLMGVAPLINRQNYPASRDWLIKRNNINPAILPHPSVFEQQPDPDGAFEAWKDRSLRTGHERLELEKVKVAGEYGLKREAAKPKKQVGRTLYGPGGATKEVWLTEGEDFTPAKGWSLAKPEKPERTDTAEDRRRDNIRQYFSNQRAAEAQAAVTYQDKKALQARMAALDRQERAENLRLSKGRPLAFEAGIQVDDYGFYEGETHKDEQGTMWRYVGGDVWERIGQTGQRGQWRGGRMQRVNPAARARE